jgi:DNA polymerase V
LPLETIRTTKKGICTSRSFGKTVHKFSELEEAVSNFAGKCAQKLRKEKSASGVVTVFIHTNSFNTIHLQYGGSRSIRLPVATNVGSEIIHYALAGLKSIFKEGYEYKKAGVIVTGIVPCNAVQQNLFDTADRAKQETLMEVLDTINEKLGKDTLKYAVQSHSQNSKWLTQRSKLSPCYTTRWNQILKAS